MHFIADTEEEDYAAELFWKEDFKKVIREKVPKVIFDELTKKNAFKGVYRKKYCKEFANYEGFVETIGSKVAIGAENGADDAFDEIYSAFRGQIALPCSRKYARYLWPCAMTAEIKKGVHNSIFREYSQEISYLADYEEHYYKAFPSFHAFIHRISAFVVVGSANGADDMLTEIYRCFLRWLPLPPSRRQPRRLKGW